MVVCCIGFIVVLILGCVLHWFYRVDYSRSCNMGFIGLLIFRCVLDGFIFLLIFDCVLHGFYRFLDIS